MPFFGNRPRFQAEDFFSLPNEEKKLAFLVNFALLAPSSHNTQPWLFKVGDTTIEVWANAKRALAASDSNNRQLFISLGCAIENLLVAADYYGWKASVEYFPIPTEPYFAARVSFAGSPRSGYVDHLAGHLISAIFTRHNNREPYKNQQVPQSFLVRLTSLETHDLKISVVHEEVKKERVCEIVLNAIEAAFQMPAFRKELSHWIRPSLKKYRDGMPGYNIGVPWPMSFIKSFSIEEYYKIQKDSLSATPVFIIIATQTDDPVDWVRAGQTFERIALMATQAGLNVGVLAVPIQIDSFYQDLQDALTTVFRPQIFFRLGYTDKVPVPSPRLRLDEVLLKQ